LRSHAGEVEDVDARSGHASSRSCRCDGLGAAGYFVAAVLGVEATATALWPNRIAYAYREGMFGSGGRTWIRTTSLGLSTHLKEAVPPDSYADYTPQNQHWISAYTSVSFFAVLLGLGRYTWETTLIVGAILLVGRFVLVARVPRARGNERGRMNRSDQDSRRER
jgi:hypothetical protein